MSTLSNQRAPADVLRDLVGAGVVVHFWPHHSRAERHQSIQHAWRVHFAATGTEDHFLSAEDVHVLAFGVELGRRREYENIVGRRAP